MVNVIMFVLLFVLLFLNVPIFIAIGVSALFGAIMTDISPLLLANIMVNTFNSFPLLAIPFFVLAGNIMGRSTMASKLIDSGMLFLGRFKSGLPITNTVACAFFASLSGSGPATTAAIGGIMIPVLRKAGYKKSFSAVINAVGGTLGPIIPPSIIMIMYGVIANVSIADLFIAGVIPGILMVLSIIIMIVINHKNFIEPGITLTTAKKTTTKEKLTVLWDAKWAIAMPAIILGGIYSGATTPTEASVIAVVYSLIVCLLITKDLNINDLKEIFKQTAITMGSVTLILGTATGFGIILTMNQLPLQISTAMYTITDNPIIILFLINILLLIVGCFMETIAAITILTPLLLPLVVSAGLSPLAFGIVMCINLVIGLVTPPVGVNLFIAAGLADVTIAEMGKDIILFIIALIIPLLLITYFPILIEFLPNLLVRY